MIPFRRDIIDVAADADAVDLAIGSEDPYRNRNVVASAGAVDHVLEQEPLALRFRNAAAELPAHQSVHLGVFVDWPLHAEKQAIAFQGSDVGVQVRIRWIFHVSPSRSAQDRLCTLTEFCENDARPTRAPCGEIESPASVMPPLVARHPRLSSVLQPAMHGSP